MSVHRRPMRARPLPASPGRAVGGPMPATGRNVVVRRRLEEIRERIDRLRRMVDADVDDPTLLRECASVRSALLGTENMLRREQAARRVSEALGAGDAARRAREELVDLVLPWRRE